MGNGARRPPCHTSGFTKGRSDYLEREYPYFIHPISDGIPRMDPDVLRATRDLIVSMVDWSEIDLIVSVEAMGLPLLASVGEASGKPTVVIRKRSYGMEGEVKVDCFTGYSKSTIYVNDIKPGERILIVDDVISTGGTLEPILEAIEANRGEATGYYYRNRERGWARTSLQRET